jgi:hypothetical protein
MKMVALPPGTEDMAPRHAGRCRGRAGRPPALGAKRAGAGSAPWCHPPRVVPAARRPRAVAGGRGLLP